MMNNYKNHNYKEHTRRGNAFLFVLIGVALFAALAMTVSRGMQSQTTTNMSARKITLAATDILDYAHKVQRAVDRVRRKGCSENEISFETAPLTGYVNANSPADKSCHVFDPNGGNVRYMVPPDIWFDSSLSAESFYGEWIFSSAFCIGGIGEGLIGCWNNNIDDEELIIFLPFINEDICTKINNSLDISSIPVNVATDTYEQFVGIFNGDSAIKKKHDNTFGKYTVCLDGNGKPGFHLQHVLIAR
ncbi:MAG: hypothetical protein KAJ86_05045 [Alphaproteobacteria bacterium]|nr:hypothetical protein [Alphaproteobacteria bacterium]